MRLPARLIEAAQHLDKHPGPLGCLFRRLCRKKTRNVAVVAVPRKLAMIGWQMLTRGEPYRYAIPRSTVGYRRFRHERVVVGLWPEMIRAASLRRAWSHCWGSWERVSRWCGFQ